MIRRIFCFAVFLSTVSHANPVLDGADPHLAVAGHSYWLYPTEADSRIRGLPVYSSLSAIDRPVDMVEIFRTSEAAYAVTEEAIRIGAKVVWMQIGVRNDEAARLAEAAGLKVVMNRCPKIELFGPFWKPRLDLPI